MTELSGTSWVEERLLRCPFASVGALVPDAFESYARVLHPAQSTRPRIVAHSANRPTLSIRDADSPPVRVWGETWTAAQSSPA